MILNQKVRTFTSKWQPLAAAGDLERPEPRAEFRKDLERLQHHLMTYAGRLAELGGVHGLNIKRPGRRPETRLAVESQQVVHTRDTGDGRLVVQCGVWPKPVVVIQEGLESRFALR